MEQAAHGEILRRILAGVDQASLRGMRLVCRAWEREITENHIARFRCAFAASMRAPPAREAIALLCCWGEVHATRRRGKCHDTSQEADIKRYAFKRVIGHEGLGFPGVVREYAATGVRITGAAPGNELCYLDFVGDVTSFDVAPQVSGAGLRLARALEHMPGLERVSVPHNRVSGRHLRNVGRLARLRTLNLHNNLMDDEACGYISGATALTDLNVSNCGVGDAGLRALCDGLASLVSLDISYNNVGPGSLAALTRLTALTRLDTRWNRFDGEACRQLQGLAGLTSLDASGVVGTVPSCLATRSLRLLGRLALRNSDLTDADIVHLTELCGLREVDLSDNHITDAGVGGTLCRMRGLEGLDVCQNMITYRGARMISRALASLQRLDISWNDVLDAGAYALMSLRLSRLGLANNGLTATMRVLLKMHARQRDIVIDVDGF